MLIKFPDESLRIKTKRARIVACRNINQLNLTNYV